MRIGLLHGWLLDGSGSNNYVRELARALTARGNDVHLICQEPHPENFSRIGRIHTPAIDRSLMPVYVADTEYEGFSEVRPFSELVSDSRLETYLEDFTRGVLRVCREEKIEVLHANHVYPMPEVARRVKERAGVPYLVFPHGSAIEYTIKPSPELAVVAAGAIDAADALVIGNKTVTERLFGLFPGHAEAWRKKHSIVSVGVDPNLFEPVEKNKRDLVVAKLRAEGLPKGGKTRARTSARGDYVRKAPDADLLEKLEEIDWKEDKILLFAGKLIVGKGLHDLVAGLPEILERHPKTTLLIVGEGPFREQLERILHALTMGERDFLLRIAGAESRQPDNTFKNIRAYVDRIGLDRWIELGRRTKPAERVTFTGYLKHPLLKHLLPCADIAVFPSEVAEAYPLVLLEAISAGVLPVASYFEGLGEGLDEIAARLSPGVGPQMRIAVESGKRVSSMVRSIGNLLDRKPDWRLACRALAASEYSWETVAGKMEEVYRRVVKS